MKRISLEEGGIPWIVEHALDAVPSMHYRFPEDAASINYFEASMHALANERHGFTGLAYNYKVHNNLCVAEAGIVWTAAEYVQAASKVYTTTSARKVNDVRFLDPALDVLEHRTAPPSDELNQSTVRLLQDLIDDKSVTSTLVPNICLFIRTEPNPNPRFSAQRVIVEFGYEAGKQGLPMVKAKIGERNKRVLDKPTIDLAELALARRRINRIAAPF